MIKYHRSQLKTFERGGCRAQEKLMENKKIRRKVRLNSYQIIIIGFAATVLFGSLLLVLPFSVKEGDGASFQDAFFTATSAVCVTGLIVRDTATYWSGFGQAVIILLIQIGGVGVMTVVACIVRFTGYKIGLLQRSTLQESISAHKVGSILKTSLFIFKITLIIEFFGVVLLAPVFCSEFGFFKGLWYSVFHSVSAFCNAGFDLMGVKEPFSSVCYFVGNPLLNVTIMLLIITGGIGFLTWQDIRTNGFRFKRYSLQSKAVIVCTLILIILPAVYFFFAEFSSEEWSGLSVGEKILASFFQSVTTRTAGFNSVDLTKFSETGITVMIILMLIGASPGSTAGGMKTTTAVILFSSLISVFRREKDPHVFGRRISSETVRAAAAVLTMYLVLFTAGGMVISAAEGLPILDCLFETASAIGTVGLTLGITPALSALSKSILVFLMFFGRVGGLTLMFAFIAQKPDTGAKLPEEKISI